MNPHNPNLPNGQQPVPQAVNMGLSNEIPNGNWRDELSQADRNRLIGSIAQALKALSPTTSENDIVAAARKFEQTLYYHSTSKVIINMITINIII
ncbi:hypothetical protein BCR43DRAFT_59705 [Syncephalastrum racemosum]|uniref:Mediator complex subunit 15 KIX domain-containing protein n=1 Tax=Syncephalastrum racemosum TaxID=13706 RepID=A0A1X2HVS4_SYNRA|nr:hypothetical protein BCR43DRAFT_59705 [Syncephalastrum racemosum]